MGADGLVRNKLFNPFGPMEFSIYRGSYMSAPLVADIEGLT